MGKKRLGQVLPLSGNPNKGLREVQGKGVHDNTENVVVVTPALLNVVRKYILDRGERCHRDNNM